MWARLFTLPFMPVFAAAISAVVDTTTAPAAWWAPLVNTGAIGAILVWFMVRMEPRMKALEMAQDRSTRADLLRLVASAHVSPELKEEATSILREIEAATIVRTK